MEQLQLTHKQFKIIGFTRENVKKKDFRGDNKNEIVYSIPVINGCIYCNYSEPINKWYLKVTIGEVANYMLLDITNLPQLQLVLSTFRVNYTLLIA